MSSEGKIKKWKEPIKFQVGRVQIRDVFAERNTPLILDMNEICRDSEKARGKMGENERAKD